MAAKRKINTDPTDYGANLHVAVRNLLRERRECCPGSKHRYLPDTDAARARLDELAALVETSPFGF